MCDQDRTGQDKTRQDRTRQDKTGQDKADRVQPMGTKDNKIDKDTKNKT